MVYYQQTRAFQARTTENVKEDHNMQFQTNLKIRNLDGAALKEQFIKVEGGDDDKHSVKVRDVTTGIALATCLLQPVDRERIPATQWSDRYLLALKMRSDESIDLTADQLTICKAVCGTHPDGMVAAQLSAYLEGKHPTWNSSEEKPQKKAK